MITKFKTAKEELDELLLQLDNDAQTALKDLLDVIPCSAHAFAKIKEMLDATTKSKYEAVIKQLTKLNALLDLTRDAQSNNNTTVNFGSDALEINILAILQDPKKSEAEKKGALVEELLHRFNVKTLEDTDEILFYQDGIYKTGAETKLVAEMERLGQHLVTNHLRNEVLSSIRARTYASRVEFDKDPDIVNLKNGLLNIKTGEFREHTPEYLSLVQLPVEYNPKSTCKPIVEFLYDIVVDPKDVPLVLEYIAYCLFKDKDLQKELVLTGPPDSGKSVLLFIITAILGTNNVSNVTMQQLSSNRFALAQLEGKLANIYADISHARLEDIERFKAIATADEVEAERKGMQLFKFKPRAKLIFSANILPKPPITVDDSFYRRWTIIQCALRDRHYFSGASIVKDPKLLQKLTTPENLSGLLNLVLISARRLLKRQRFCKALPTDQTRELYDRLSNPVQQWIEECLEQDSDSYIETNDGYRSYVEFCKVRKIGATTKEWLGKELARLGYPTDQKRLDGKQKRVWLGLKGVTRNPPFPSLTKQIDPPVDKGKDPLRVTNIIIQPNNITNNNEASSDGEVFYCPEGCNHAFATQAQVDAHLHIFHEAKEVLQK